MLDTEYLGCLTGGYPAGPNKSVCNVRDTSVGPPDDDVTFLTLSFNIIYPDMLDRGQETELFSRILFQFWKLREGKYNPLSFKLGSN